MLLSLFSPKYLTIKRKKTQNYHQSLFAFIVDNRWNTTYHCCSCVTSKRVLEKPSQFWVSVRYVRLSWFRFLRFGNSLFLDWISFSINIQKCMWEKNETTTTTTTIVKLKTINKNKFPLYAVQQHGFKCFSI